MRVYNEINLTEFEAWSGAKDTIKYLTAEELDAVESNINDIFPEGVDATQLNDILWFEDEMIAEWLGYESFDEIIER